jgi:ribonuclease HII
MILGIDEVGRGPWAGPLVVGAVVLGNTAIEGLADSKKLSPRRREALAVQIHAKAVAIGLGWVHAAELDEVGMSQALRLATVRAVEQIHTPYHEIILDGTINFLSETSKGSYVTVLAKADALVPAVSAASIVAKVARDAYMAQQEAVYPGYSFAKNAGYGTAAHRAAIRTKGVTPLHRLSFAPLASYRLDTGQSGDRQHTGGLQPTTRRIGDASEQLAAEWLEEKGHVVIKRNWRTKYCEVDIISQKEGEIYFVEVKHRGKPESGDGLAAITRQKEMQMRRAAQLYLSRQSSLVSAHLMVIATSGESLGMSVDQCLELE